MATCFIAEAMDGAFCLKLSAVRPLAAVCRAANAVFTCSTSGWRTGEAEASALSRLVFNVRDRGFQRRNTVLRRPHLREVLE